MSLLINIVLGGRIWLRSKDIGIVKIVGFFGMLFINSIKAGIEVLIS